eukprot:Gb_37309 [translate_table: standard]
MVAVVLNRLPPSFEHFVETINMTAYEDLTFDQVSNFLLQKERWRTHFQGESSRSDMALESAFAAKTKATRRREHPLLHFKGNSGGAQGNLSGNTSSSDSISHSSRSRIRCFYCGKIGHMKRDYRKRLFNLENSKGQSSQRGKRHAKVAECEEEEEECAFVVS